METTRTLSHFIILVGDDTIAREQARLRYIAQVKSLHPEFTMERYDSSTEDFGQYTQRIITPSLFQDIRVFHINHAQSLSDKELDMLGSIFDYDLPDAFVIVESDVAGKGGKSGDSKLDKKLQLKKRSGKVLYEEFIRPPDYKISQWLQMQAPALFNRTINKADADFLVDLVGYDLDALHSELQKIDIHLAPGAPIDRKAIEEITGVARVMTVYELASALGQKNAVRALQIIDSLFATSFYAPTMIGALYRHFWALFRIRKFAEANPDIMKKFNSSKGYANPAQNDAAFAIGRAAGLLMDGEQRKVYPVIIASGIVSQVAKFSEQDLKAILKWLLEFDVGTKTGRITPDQQAVQMFCYKIMRSSELHEESLV